jgi:hypothetical protein
VVGHGAALSRLHDAVCSAIESPLVMVYIAEPTGLQQLHA